MLLLPELSWLSCFVLSICSLTIYLFCLTPSRANPNWHRVTGPIFLTCWTDRQVYSIAVASWILHLARNIDTESPPSSQTLVNTILASLSTTSSSRTELLDLQVDTRGWTSIISNPNHTGLDHLSYVATPRRVFCLGCGSINTFYSLVPTTSF